MHISFHDFDISWRAGFIGTDHTHRRRGYSFVLAVVADRLHVNVHTRSAGSGALVEKVTGRDLPRIIENG